MAKLPNAKRVMPSVIYNGTGVSPMAAPKGSVFQMKKRYPQAGSSGLKGPTGKSGTQMQQRDILRGRNNIRYHNNLLTADRVRQVFGFHSDYDDYYGESAKDSSWEFELRDEHYVPDNYQYELQLENVDEVEGKLQRMINRYQAAIDHMGAMALLWNDLMDDLEANPHLQEQFDKFQMLRKLSGGTM